MNDNNLPTRHEQALDIATKLVETIHQLTKRMPEEEDMVMVPMMRTKVMELQSAVMMLAYGELHEEDFNLYTDDVFGRSAALRIQLDMCQGLGYLDQPLHKQVEAQLDTLANLAALPQKPSLSLIT